MRTKRKQSSTMLVLRTCKADLTSYNGFQWPESGPIKAPDWNGRPVCGGGLHGLPWGEGDAKLCDLSETAKWLVVEVDEACVLTEAHGKDLIGKCKFPCGVVVFVGSCCDAAQYIHDNGGAGRAIVGLSATAGDAGTATAGYAGTATAGYAGTATAGYAGTATAGYAGTATAGYAGTATAGDAGTATAGYAGTATAGDAGTATAGNRGTATAGDAGTATAGYAGTATAGNAGTATAGYAGTATAGKRGTATAGDAGTATAGDAGTATAGNAGTATAGDAGTATAGNRGTATAGKRGTIQIRRWDGIRYRVVTGYIGEDGLLADKAYVLDEQGCFVEKAVSE